MSAFYPALDQQRDEGLNDYIARLEREQTVTSGSHFDLPRHRAISDHLVAATDRLQGLALERVKEAVAGLSTEDRGRLLRWLTESHPIREE